MNVLECALDALELGEIGYPAMAAVVVVDGAGNRLVALSGDVARYPELARHISNAAEVCRSYAPPQVPDLNHRQRDLIAEKLASEALCRANGM